MENSTLAWRVLSLICAVLRIIGRVLNEFAASGVLDCRRPFAHKLFCPVPLRGDERRFLRSSWRWGKGWPGDMNVTTAGNRLIR